MHFTHATVLAALAANILATPIPQIGGEAQACEGLVNGVTDGVGNAVSNVVGDVTNAIKLRRSLYRRQGTGLANACYDIVNNVDQGVGYTVGSFLSGAVGDSGDEVTGSSAVGNTGSSGGSSAPPPAGGAPPPPANRRRQVAEIAQSVQGLADKAGLGSATSGLTSTLETTSDDLDTGLTDVGAEVGTLEAAPTSELGGDLGNAVHDVLTGSIGSTGGSTGAAPPPPAGSAPPPPAKRQLNKIATGLQDTGNALGLNAVVTPVDDALDELDTIGTSGVGDAGNSIGQAVDNTLSSI